MRAAAIAAACLALAAAPAAAQSVTIDLGGEGALTLQVVQLFLLLSMINKVTYLTSTMYCSMFLLVKLLYQRLIQRISIYQQRFGIYHYYRLCHHSCIG